MLSKEGLKKPARIRIIQMNATSSLVYDDYKSFQLTQKFLIINFTQKCFCIFILYLILCFWFAIDSPKCPKVISIFLAVVWRAATLLLPCSVLITITWTQTQGRPTTASNEGKVIRRFPKISQSRTLKNCPGCVLMST